jgi:N-acetylglucosamine kinase-like BadF-type ATPase
MNSLTEEPSFAAVQEPERDQFWLGIDGGGTNTRAAILNTLGELCGQGRAAAANFLRVGLEMAVRNITRAVDEACLQAGISPAQIAGACIGLAGVQHPKHHRQMYQALKSALPIRTLSLETDARIALAGATDLRPGVVIIAGTGSISCGINSRGKFARAGGWGPAMGDEGSGYYIGRRALETVVSAYDGRSLPTSLTEKVCHHFGVANPTELPPVIYHSSTKVMREIAQLSKVVVEAAREGDTAAQGIITDAALELARAVAAVIEQLGMQEETFRVAYVGGVFEAGEMILAPLRESIALVAPGAFLAPPLYAPVIGAVKLALASREKQQQLVK